MKIIILAGGQGKRLWPVSTQQFPKQFVHFGDHDSLLKKTVRRFSKQDLIKNVYVVTHAQYASRTLEEIQEFDLDFCNRLLLEPYSKNTAPAIAWSIRSLLLNAGVSEEELLAIIPIDHVFSNEEAFLDQMLDGIAEMSSHEIVSFGVKCHKPATGYGYIQKGKRLSRDSYCVEQFIEKPLEHVARQLMHEGDWLWNVGIYAFSIKTYLEALKGRHKVLYDIAIGRPYSDEEYQHLAPISIDDAIITDAPYLRVRVLEQLEWSDIGSWDHLCEFLAPNHNQQVQLGNVGRGITKPCVLVQPEHRISRESIVTETEECFFIS